MGVPEDGCTVFVDNLPFSVGNSELEEFFGDIGLLKRAFVVADKRRDDLNKPGLPTDNPVKKNRGIGYVEFAVKEDASNAVHKLNGKTLDGRQIRCRIAVGRQENRGRKRKAPDSEMASEEKPSNDADGEERPAKAAKKQKPVRAESGAQETKKGHKSPDKVTQEGKKKHKTGDSGPQETKKGEKKPIAAVAGARDKKPRKDAGGSEFGGKARLIVRNLPFTATHTTLRKIFMKFGKVRGVEVPKKSADSHLNRGFAFVEMDTMELAREAIKKGNEIKFGGRPIAVDFALAKDNYVQRLDAKATNPSESAVATTASEGAAEGSSRLIFDSDEDDSSASGHADTKDEDSDAEGGEGDSGSEDSGSGASEGEGEVDSGSDGESDAGAAGGAKAGASAGPGRPQGKSSTGSKQASRKETELLRSVFVRNVPVTASEEELKEVFARFGPVELCLMVKDHKTGVPRGTAFVRYKTPQHAVDAVRAAAAEDEAEYKKRGEAKGKIDRFATDEDAKFVMFGRRLFVKQAVTRDDASSLAHDRVAAKEAEKKRDKRNLHLATEGLITKNSEAATQLSEKELSRRARLYSEKKDRLKDPNKFISTTRLSVHNLPLNVSEREVKAIFNNYVIDAAKTDKTLQRGRKILHVKIVRDTERTDADGTPRSRGFGFVEFSNHRHALAALRAINNNPEVFGENKRPIVEFSVEDRRALKKLESAKLRRSGGDKDKDKHRGRSENDAVDDRKTAHPSGQSKKFENPYRKFKKEKNKPRKANGDSEAKAGSAAAKEEKVASGEREGNGASGKASGETKKRKRDSPAVRKRKRLQREQELSGAPPEKKMKGEPKGAHPTANSNKQRPLVDPIDNIAASVATGGEKMGSRRDKTRKRQREEDDKFEKLVDKHQRSLHGPVRSRMGPNPKRLAVARRSGV